MLGPSGFSSTAGPPLGWSLMFAREPEPDLDLEDTADGEAGSGHAPQKPQKPSGRRPTTLLLLLVLVAVGAYIAMDPGMLMSLLGMDTEPVSEAPPPPRPLAKAPGAPPAVQPAKSAAPAPAAPAAPGTPAPAAPPSPPPQTTTPPSSTPTPLYREGQRVTILPDPAQPGGPISLHGDAAGTRPGPLVQPGAALTVMDGEWRGNAWIYSVRTQDGAVGWIPEAKLKAKS
ncbi:hypothetical protein [Nitrospira sp. Kam-Ns4a]